MEATLEKFENILKKYNKAAIDTCIFIYHFEGKNKFSNVAYKIFSNIEKGKISAYCSTLTLTEILTLPYKAGKIKEAMEYELLIKTFPNLYITPVVDEIAVNSAILRAKYNLNTADSIHISTALFNDCPVFITNDFKLKDINQVKIICLEELL